MEIVGNEVDYKKAWEDLREGLISKVGQKTNPNEKLILINIVEQMERIEKSQLLGINANIKL